MNRSTILTDDISSSAPEKAASGKAAFEFPSSPPGANRLRTTGSKRDYQFPPTASVKKSECVPACSRLQLTKPSRSVADFDLIPAVIASGRRLD
jgi:hypothetical protein